MSDRSALRPASGLSGPPRPVHREEVARSIVDKLLAHVVQVGRPPDPIAKGSGQLATSMKRATGSSFAKEITKAKDPEPLIGKKGVKRDAPSNDVTGTSKPASDGKHDVKSYNHGNDLHDIADDDEADLSDQELDEPHRLDQGPKPLSNNERSQPSKPKDIAQAPASPSKKGDEQPKPDLSDSKVERKGAEPSDPGKSPSVAAPNDEDCPKDEVPAHDDPKLAESSKPELKNNLPLSDDHGDEPKDSAPAPSRSGPAKPQAPELPSANDPNESGKASNADRKSIDNEDEPDTSEREAESKPALLAGGGKPATSAASVNNEKASSDDEFVKEPKQSGSPHLNANGNEVLDDQHGAKPQDETPESPENSQSVEPSATEPFSTPSNSVKQDGKEAGNQDALNKNVTRNDKSSSDAKHEVTSFHDQHDQYDGSEEDDIYITDEVVIVPKKPDPGQDQLLTDQELPTDDESEVDGDDVARAGSPPPNTASNAAENISDGNEITREQTGGSEAAPPVAQGNQAQQSVDAAELVHNDRYLQQELEINPESNELLDTGDELSDEPESNETQILLNNASDSNDPNTKQAPDKTKNQRSNSIESLSLGSQSSIVHQLARRTSINPPDDNQDQPPEPTKHLWNKYAAYNDARVGQDLAMVTALGTAGGGLVTATDNAPVLANVASPTNSAVGPTTRASAAIGFLSSAYKTGRFFFRKWKLRRVNKKIENINKSVQSGNITSAKGKERLAELQLLKNDLTEQTKWLTPGNVAETMTGLTNAAFATDIGIQAGVAANAGGFGPMVQSLAFNRSLVTTLASKAASAMGAIAGAALAPLFTVTALIHRSKWKKLKALRNEWKRVQSPTQAVLSRGGGGNVGVVRKVAKLVEDKVRKKQRSHLVAGLSDLAVAMGSAASAPWAIGAAVGTAIAGAQVVLPVAAGLATIAGCGYLAYRAFRHVKSKVRKWHCRRARNRIAEELKQDIGAESKFYSSSRSVDKIIGHYNKLHPAATIDKNEMTRQEANQLLRFIDLQLMDDDTYTASKEIYALLKRDPPLEKREYDSVHPQRPEVRLLKSLNVQFADIKPIIDTNDSLRAQNKLAELMLLI